MNQSYTIRNSEDGSDPPWGLIECLQHGLGGTIVIEPGVEPASVSAFLATVAEFITPVQGKAKENPPEGFQHDPPEAASDSFDPGFHESDDQSWGE